MTLCALLVAAALLAPATPVASASEVTGSLESAGEAQPTQADGKDKKKADAPAKVRSEVVVLLATNEGKGIDPRLGDLPELKKPPFSAYDTYSLVEKHELELGRGKAVEQKLPDGGLLKVTYEDVVAGEKSEPRRFLLSTSILKADGKAFLPDLDVKAEQGKYFFVAGPRHKGGVLVIGIRVVKAE